MRGITLISMMLFHMCWDLRFMFGVKMDWFTATPGVVWERSICIPFILMSGFCLNFGKKTINKIKRGIIISVCGAIVTLISILFLPDSPIYYGVLTFIGFAMILFALVEKYIEKFNPYIMAIINLILFILFYKAGIGLIRFPGLFEIKIPDQLYKNMLTTFLGFPYGSFYSSDYFPVIPWVFMYGLGFYLGIIFEKKKLLHYLTKPGKTPINFMGRHTLPIYMIHQPVIYGLLLLVFR